MPLKTASDNAGLEFINNWLKGKGMQPFEFQLETWEAILRGESGMVNAPTGFGKTYSVFLGAVIHFIYANPLTWKKSRSNGLRLLWITPLRALAKDIARAMEEALDEIGLPWKVALRNGDTPQAERERQKRNMPEILIITPESLHLLFASKNHGPLFSRLQFIAVDEWHELIGSKRGVQTELALAYLQFLASKNPQPAPQIWGISATIGNMPEARQVLLYSLKTKGTLVKARLKKNIQLHTVLPDEIEKYPWAGHLGLKLADKMIPVIDQSKTTLVFINTRGMSERWYQHLLDVAPELSGAMALHHGSLEQELRLWVEEALHTQKLKAVVATSSLDLGVDFRPVDTVIQVGSPKGVSRFLQRAGRAGHQPHEVSHIYFVPTHALEILEAVALKKAIEVEEIETRQPRTLCFDVLCQFLCTLAVGDGFKPFEALRIAKKTWCFKEMNTDEWENVLAHLTHGGNALEQYDEYHKLVKGEDGKYVITNRRMAMRHRMHIGTIVSDVMLKIKYQHGGYLGHLEEYFISRLDPGDAFTLAGQVVELVQVKDMTALVRKSNQKKAIVPAWNGGRMSLSANLGKVLRQTFEQCSVLVEHVEASKSLKKFPAEMQALLPLLQLQKNLSHIPRNNELLIEQFESREGYHLLVYPFEGRQIHEAMSAILAYRISRIMPISFSIAMNDYGFELLSDVPIPVDDSNVQELFTTNRLFEVMQQSVNHVEMAMRKFRDIAVIGGIIFQGMPGERKKARHLQASSSLIFKVLQEFEPNNILYRQAYQEVFEQEMDEPRLREAFTRISENPVVLTFPVRITPFSFPIVADGLNRNSLTSENLEERIRKLSGELGRK